MSMCVLFFFPLFFFMQHVERVGTRTCSEPHRREGAALGLLLLKLLEQSISQRVWEGDRQKWIARDLDSQL